MVMMDDHSKWPEILVMPSTTAEETVKQFRSVMARLGITEQIVPDNGPPFTAELFQTFAKSKGIRHAPYDPAINGLVERLVRGLKRALKADKTYSNI